MSKITVTTIAGLTSGGDANTVKIESGDAFNVVSGATTLGGNLTVDTNTLHVDATNNKVAIGTASPQTSASSASLQINKDGEALRIDGTADTAREIFFRGVGTSNVASIHSDGSLKIRAEDSGTHVEFHTADSERSRITAAGDLLVGTSTKETNGVTIYGSTANGFYVKTTSTCGYLVTQAGSGGSGTFMTLYSDTTSVGSITTNGSATAYNTSSDYRLKENVVTDWDATTRLKKLKPSRFNFKTDKDTTVDGFLAHEVSSIVPEAITGKKDAVDKDGNIEPQSIDQSKLVPLLVKTIQELEARISVLESK